MLVELYDRPPDSGTVEERWFDAAGTCTWVRFISDEHGEWAGVFGRGEIVKHDRVALCGDQRTVLVVAGGQGYVVDAHTGELHHKTEIVCISDAIPVPDRNFVIACDFTSLYAVSKSGVVWRSPRIALDGIRLETATPESVTGEAWRNDGWHRFSVTSDGWQVQGATPDD